jgi:hypothetical protein
MSCLDVRRILLAAPRERTATDFAHIVVCPPCARLAASADDFERALERAVLVEAPDSLADRILLAREWRARRIGRMAVAIMAALTIAALLVAQLYQPPAALQTLGAKHPAVAAITEVLRQRDRAAPSAGRPAANEDLRRLGLNLPASEGRAEYVGECHLADSTACEHIVVTTARERASVLLVPHVPAAKRLMVADRRMVALMSATPAGGFIVVAESPESARRVEKLLLRPPVEAEAHNESTEIP